MGYEKKLYAIREIAEITGVKPVTLRAWQRRYNLVQPQRTDKGHRLFSDADIALIGEIQGWLSKGVPIGKVKGILESSDPNKGEEFLATDQLDEVSAFLQALAELNKAKADAIVAIVFKEYPLEVVEKQFVRPTEKALSVVKFGLRALQKGLMDAIFVARLNAIIESENKAAKAGKCLFINYDNANNLHARLWALKQSESGKHLVIIDGIEDLSGLIEHQGLDAYATLAIYSSRPITAGQSVVLAKIRASFAGQVLLSDLINN
ncbi:MerR family transcriptional regulator [Vibrio galatheae]|uniref:MerR family transcriptional regulator n=1 Tax=Vibrio galatheae TaxID=579748 RepID=A0A0F4NN06_9VIBR|nr:MerR family transcriptional regulator [Vibrio galatheae]KJY84530.1 MerR family transcriptional regulator [Vibrio galatheae]